MNLKFREICRIILLKLNCIRNIIVGRLTFGSQIIIRIIGVSDSIGF